MWLLVRIPLLAFFIEDYCWSYLLHPHTLHNQTNMFVWTLKLASLIVQEWVSFMLCLYYVLRWVG